MNTLTTLSIAIVMAFAFSAPAHAGDEIKNWWNCSTGNVIECPGQNGLLGDMELAGD
ncbi:MAG: hypothetical protein V6Z81_10655 [Parvularculales bacterium]